MTKTALGKRRSRSRYAKRKEALQKEHFVNIYHDLEEQKKQLEEMDEEDKLQMQAEKAKLKALFREDDDGIQYYPIIIKAN